MNEVENLQQAQPNRYGGIPWFTYSGTNLVEEVNALDPNSVIDVGCAANYFKNKIKNLIGFDKGNFPDADYRQSIDDIEFPHEGADIILALGSIQFDSIDTVNRHLTKVLTWLKPGGQLIMRTRGFLNEGETSGGPGYYDWTKSDFDHFTEKFNLTVTKGIFVDKIPEHKGSWEVWWWQKK